MLGLIIKQRHGKEIFLACRLLIMTLYYCKDDTWINKSDIIKDFSAIPKSIDNEQLRAQINNYFYSALPEKATAKDRSHAVSKVIIEYPEFIDYYIKYKEERGDEDESSSLEKVKESAGFYVEQLKLLIQILDKEIEFYHTLGDTFEESMERVICLKNVIENKDGYRIFYSNGIPIKKEDDLQIMYRLTWYATISDVIETKITSSQKRHLRRKLLHLKK
jgi:hypothetical protein